MAARQLQRNRLLFQTGFMLLFVLAPPLNIFRLDLNLGHFILFGYDWTLGIDDFIAGKSGIGDAAFNLFVKGFIPLFGGGAIFLWVAWRFGRLYCGWLCPHFFVVEMINGLLLRATGKPSLWEKKPLPEQQPDGSLRKPDRRYWPLTLLAVVIFGFLWAVTLLTYLLPPQQIYFNLLSGELSRNQFAFIAVATLLFCIEFTFARHLFCRYACAVGLFQSLAWMANPRAMVVGFNRSRAKDCKDCNNACDNVCPMRLNPRTIKRKMFTCTECGQCISACTQVQQPKQRPSLLQWVDRECALPVVSGRKSDKDAECFSCSTKDNQEYVSVQAIERKT